MNVLLDYDCLIFKKEELIEEKPLRIRSASHFEASYLRKNFKNIKFRLYGYWIREMKISNSVEHINIEGM